MGNQVNIPALRFPEFSELWSEKTFGDLYSFKPTNSFSRDMLNYEAGEVKNIHYGDIHTKFNLLFDIEKEIVPYINSGIKISGITEENYIQEGDLILADASEDYNDIGKSIEIINLNNEMVLSGLHTILARRKTDDLTIGFIAFLMKTYNVRLEIMRIAQGTKVLGLSSRRLAEVPLWLPKPNEQAKIATFLTAIDKRINLLTNQKEQLEHYKKGLMHKIFSQELRFKDDNGEEFPDWEEKILGEIGKPYSGLTGKSKDDFGKGMPYIQYKQIFDNSKIDITRFEYVTINENDNQNKVEYGDIFFTVSSETPNEIGISSVLLNKVEELYLNSFCFGFRPNSLDDLVPEFARYLFRSDNARSEIVKLAQGSTRYNLSKVAFMRLKFLLPKKEEQLKIAAILSNLDSNIELITNQINESVCFKKGLLQKLFV